MVATTFGDNSALMLAASSLQVNIDSGTILNTLLGGGADINSYNLNGENGEVLARKFGYSSKCRLSQSEPFSLQVNGYLEFRIRR